MGRGRVALLVAGIVLSSGCGVRAEPPAEVSEKDRAAIAGQLLQAAREQALRLTDPGARRSTLFSVAESQAQAGHQAEARATIEEAKQACAQTALPRYLDIVRLQAKLGDFAAAQETAALEDDPGNLYHAIVEAQLEAKDIPGAQATLAKIAAGEWHDRAAGALHSALVESVKSQAQAGDLAGAKATLAQIEDKAPKIRALIAWGGAALKAGQAEEGKRALREATSLSREVPFNERAYLEEVIEAYVEGGDFAGAYATLFGAGSRLDDPARQYLSGIIARASVGTPVAVVSDVLLAPAAPDQRDQNAVELACVKAEEQIKKGDAAGAKASLREAETALPKTPLFNQGIDYPRVARLWAELGDLDRALEMAARGAAAKGEQVAGYLRNVGDPYRPLEQQSVTVQTGINTALQQEAHNLAALGDLERGLVYSVCDALAKRNDMAAAQALVARISDPGVRAECFLIIAEAEIKNGKTAEAQASLQEAFAFAEKMQSVFPKDDVFTRIAKAYAAAGDWEGAHAAIKPIHVLEHQQAALFSVMRSQVAREEWGSAKTSATLIPHPGVRIEALLELAQAMAKKAAARERQAVSEETLRAVEEFPAGVDRNQVYLRIIQGQVVIADSEGITATLAHINDPLTHAVGLVFLAGAQIAQKQRTEALATLRQCRKETGSLVNPDDPPTLLVGISNLYARAQEPGEAQAAIQEAKESLTRVVSDEVRWEKTLEVAQQQALLGDTSGAKETLFAAAEPPQERVKALLQTAAHVMRKAKRPASAN